MKKICCGIFLVLCTIILCSCNSFEIQGLDRFNENDCCFGLNYGLLPEGQDFLSDFLYEDGDYRYKRNNYGKAQAKTFVMLQYPEYVYQEVKAVCQNYFVFSVSMLLAAIRLLGQHFLVFGCLDIMTIHAQLFSLDI